jgi:hypothetical protein
MMKWLKDNAPNQDYKIIASKTYETLIKLQKKGFNFPVEFTSRSLGGAQGQVEMRFFDRTTLPMRINNTQLSVNDAKSLGNLYSDNGVNFQTLLHEAIHQATLTTVRDFNAYIQGKKLPKDLRAPVRLNKKAIKALEDLENVQDKVNEYIEQKKEYYTKIGLDMMLSYNAAMDAKTKETTEKAYNKFKQLRKEYSIEVRKESGIIKKLACNSCR